MTTTAEPTGAGGWRHTHLHAHEDHDTRLIVEYIPPDRSGEWTRVGHTHTEVTWRNQQLTGRKAKTPIVRTRQTRDVGPWVDDAAPAPLDGQEELPL